MGELGHAESFKDLLVYQKAMALARDIFDISKSFHKEEMYSLIDQIRRSSRSIGAQIAEAWAKRRYKNHFISKLTDADGEQLETQHWILIAKECDYIDSKQEIDMANRLSEIGKMLNVMIEKADQFCGILPTNSCQ